MITRRFDHLFRAHRGRLPVTFLRVLAKRESNMNPAESVDPAWGLMQVVPVVLEDYNRRHGTSYSRAALLDPAVNVKIAADLLNRIVDAYEKHPDRNMKPDWSNPEFVKLVVAGWNSGYSEGGGVGKVASYLEQRGIPVTHDNVFAHSAAAGATRHLRNAAKKEWQRSVADLFYADGGPGMFENMPGGGIAKLALTGFIAWGVYKLLE